MKNVVEFLKINSDNNPDRLFCCDDVYKYTYRESYRIVMSIASYFHSRGITNQPVLLKAERNC